MTEQVRYSLIVWEMMQVLREADWGSRPRCPWQLPEDQLSGSQPVSVLPRAMASLPRT